MKTPISSKKLKKKVPQTRHVTLADGTVVKTNDNKKNDLLRGKTSKHVIPKAKFSTESGKNDSEWEVTDDLDESDYPPPSRHPVFRKFWSETIDNIVKRENFIPSHLALLEALCRMKSELQALDEFVQRNGHTFRIVTVLGEQRKTYPEVQERLKVLNLIAKYMEMLDLVPRKDKSKSVNKKDEDAWA